MLLDVEDLVPGAEYTLEASSPGLDRKLTRPEDFRTVFGLAGEGADLRADPQQPALARAADSQGWAGADEVITLDLNAVKQNSKSRKTGREHGGDCAKQHREGAIGAGDLRAVVSPP